eukprot:479322-Alexandrium_andersonii.AAC.1
MHRDPSAAREAISRQADPLFSQVERALEGALAAGDTTKYWQVWSTTMEQAILSAKLPNPSAVAAPSTGLTGNGAAAS